MGDRLPLLFWKRVSPVLFPLTPKTVEGLVSFLFWHSMALTATTPLFRMIHGRWRGESSICWAIQKIVSEKMFQVMIDRGYVHPGLDYAREGEEVAGAGLVRGIDVAFGMHAAASLTWVICAYVQIVHGSRFGKFHRRFGYVALLAFIAHTCCALFNLYTDVVRHTPLPKMMLASSLLTSAGLMFQAIRTVVKKEHGWLLKHQNEMVQCFILSIQGAGTIRMVSHIETFLGYGSVRCQAQHSGMATQCLWPYVYRMFFLATVSLYYRGVYVKMRNDEKLIRTYLYDAAQFFVLFLITVTFSYVPHAEWILGLVLGSERSYQGAITTLFVIVMMLKTTFGGKSTAAHASKCAMPTKPFEPSCAMTPQCPPTSVRRMSSGPAFILQQLRLMMLM